jgi:hypothetical protein
MDAKQRSVQNKGERWARLRRTLWQPPRPHGEQPRERTVGPLELFYDLAVVALVAQAAHHLAGHLNWPGFGQFAAVFTLVWIAWVNGSLHHELHGHEDARARSTFLLQILLLAAMGAFIPQADGSRGAAFAVAAAVLFGVLAVLWLLAGRGDRPEYHRPDRLYVAGTVACAVLLAATAPLPASVRVQAWGVLDVAYLVGFAFVLLTTGAPQAPGLIVTEALTERFGSFIIIVPTPLGCCARAPLSCWARRWCWPPPCRTGTATATCTGRSPAPAVPPPWPASAWPPSGHRRFSSSSRSLSCSASPGDSPSRTDAPVVASGGI